MITYIDACQIIESNFVKDGENIDVSSLLISLMKKHNYAFDDDMSWIMSEYF